mmetsp:Transcript_17923/g.32461  ORF Transcript_17923/g.32461 Transcript_17923/m.32461 type:complete len:181 (+) Transcript_17923:59-601(+)
MPASSVTPFGMPVCCLHEWTTIWNKGINQLLSSTLLVYGVRSWLIQCLFLAGGGEPCSIIFESLSGPVILGLGHVVSPGDTLDPTVFGVSSTLGVEVGVVLEYSGLLDILGVPGVLGALVRVTDFLVLSSGKTSGDVGFVADGSNLQVLAFACTVVVLGGNRGEQIHLSDTLEEGLLLGF